LGEYVSAADLNLPFADDPVGRLDMPRQHKFFPARCLSVHLGRLYGNAEKAHGKAHVAGDDRRTLLFVYASVNCFLCAY
jgi:hypothetical protein